MKRMYVAVVLAILLVAIAGTAAVGQTYWQRFDNVLVRSLESLSNIDVDGVLTVDGASTHTGAVTNSGTLNQVGNATFAGTVAVNGSRLAIADWLAAAPGDALTVTDGGIITPTGTLQPLTAAGPVTASLAAGSSGDVLILYNSAAQNITIEDTTGQLFASTYVMGQYDTLTLVFYGTSWVELARSVN